MPLCCGLGLDRKLDGWPVAALLLCQKQGVRSLSKLWHKAYIRPDQGRMARLCVSLMGGIRSDCVGVTGPAPLMAFENTICYAFEINQSLSLR